MRHERKPLHQRSGMKTIGFGTVPDGREAGLYVLTNATGCSATVTNYGGILTSLVVPDKQGNLSDIVLGYDRLDSYLKDDCYLGSIIGRYGNRIGHGCFTIDGRVFSVARNNVGNHLHGGETGFGKRLWIVHPGPNAGRLELSHVSPDGDQGYPGCLDVTVTYTLTDANEFRIDYRATTDRPTVVNLTSHSYFNLAGPASDTILDHEIRIIADRFTPVGADLIPTGEIRPVEGTPMDFRRKAAIGARIDDDFDQLRLGGGYDHNWVLSNSTEEPTPAAEVFEPITGRVMQVLTTEPGIQFYTGNFLGGPLVGKAGRPYPRRCGFCLETQHFPDSPNRPEFPSTVLRPGETYNSSTIYSFSVT